MIKVDRRDDRHIGLDDVGRVEASAETGLENGDVDFRIGKVFQRKRSRDFEKCRMRIPVRDEISNSPEAACGRIFRNHFAIDTNAFAEGDKVRGDEETRAITLRAADGIDHRANGAFAVRPGDMDDASSKSLRRGAEHSTRGARAPQAKFVEQTPNVLQAELDPEALEAIEPGERLSIADRRVSRHADPRGLARPSRSAPASSIHGVTAK